MLVCFNSKLLHAPRRLSIKTLRNTPSSLSAGIHHQTSHILRPTSMTTIDLTATEKNICSLLKSFVAVSPFEKPIVCRITGGWVRDKLLGLESHDLDIAIDTYTGLEFAEALNKYIDGNSEKLGLSAKSIHKIERNPEKSKHLETATTKLYGLDIDFVNLRCEEYADDSRIPTIRFGTPEEDAFRRDATLNALFYNVMEDKIEDFTKRGLEDLKAGILRTPLDPFETFKEDPLRVLRIIRFASRFGFSIASQALNTMKDPIIHQALIHKISRERVGVEIMKTLTGPRPAEGLQIISDLDLEEAVFNTLPPDSKSQVPPYNQLPPSKLGSNIKNWQLCMNHKSISKYLDDASIPASFHMFAWLGLPYLRLASITGLVGKKTSSLSFIFISESLKMISTSETSFVANSIDSIHSAREAVSSQSTSSRKELGTYIRSAGKYWKLHIIYSLIYELSSCGGSDKEKCIDSYGQFFALVDHHNLGEAWALKPILNGGEIQKALKRKPGPWMSKLMDEIIGLQLENPDITKEDVYKYLEEAGANLDEQSLKKQKN